MKLFKTVNGMNITGVGPKIMRTILPALIAAVLLHLKAPGAARIPGARALLFPIGIAFITVGLALWACGAVQLLRDFPKGRLIRNGAYGLCRNPLYSAVALFFLPGLSFLTGTWVYLAVSPVMVLAISRFVRKEENDLLKIFGREYAEYASRVGRIFPFVKPAPLTVQRECN